MGPGWKGVKGLARSYVRPGSGVTPQSILRDYVRALGGAAAAASGATAGQVALRKMAQLFANAQSLGTREAFRLAGLGHLAGRDTTSVLCGLLDELTGPGSLLEEAAAKKAMQDLLDERFSEIEDWEALDHALSATDLSGLIRDFICMYIFVRITQDLGMRLENGSPSPENLSIAYEQLLTCIQAVVGIDTEGIDPIDVDWAGQQGHDLIARWIAEAYGFLEED